MNRRNFLKGVVGVGTAGALAGCFTRSGRPGGPGGSPGFSGGGEVNAYIDHQQYADRFDEVVDATNPPSGPGADPTGQESINPILNSYVRPGTLLVFPSGEYLMDRPHRIPDSGPVGVIGQSATIRHGAVESISGHNVTSGEYSGSTIMFNAGSSDDPFSGFLVFGGFVFDFSQENEGMQALNAHTTGEAIVENIRIHGAQDLGTHGPFRLSTQSDPSVMLVRNIDQRWGGKHYVNTLNTRQTPRKYGPDRPGPSWSTSGLTLTSEQAGTMLFENMKIGAWPDNGLYAKGGVGGNSIGRKIVRNCTTANSNVSNIRINDGPDWVPHPWIDGNDETPAQGYEHSVIEGCEVIVDNNFDTSIFGNQLGIRLDGGSPILRDTTVVLREPNGPGIRVQGGVSGAQIENCRVDLHDQGRGIVMAGSGSVADSVVNTVGFSSSGVIAGISSGVNVQQLSPSEVEQAQSDNQADTTHNQTEQP